jgi:hypothetical protein
MTAIDPELLTFEYSLRYRGAPGLDHDPSDYPMRWTVTVAGIVVTDDGGDDGDEVQIGSAVVYVVPKAGMINLFLTTDGADQEMVRVAEMLTTDRPDLVTEYLQDGGDLMIVSSLEISPEYRGDRIGYTALHAIIETVGRAADLVVVHAAPASSDSAPGEGSPEDVAAKAALRSYWLDFGFEEAAGDYLAFVKKKILE